MGGVEAHPQTGSSDQFRVSFQRKGTISTRHQQKGTRGVGANGSGPGQSGDSGQIICFPKYREDAFFQPIYQVGGEQKDTGYSKSKRIEPDSINFTVIQREDVGRPRNPTD